MSHPDPCDASYLIGKSAAGSCEVSVSWLEAILIDTGCQLPSDCLLSFAPSRQSAWQRRTIIKHLRVQYPHEQERHEGSWQYLRDGREAILRVLAASMSHEMHIILLPDNKFRDKTDSHEQKKRV